MERAVFFIAIGVAAVIGLGALVDGPHVHFGHMGDFGERRAPIVVASAEQLAGRPFDADEASVKHAALRLVVAPEDRADIEVEIDNPGRLPTPEVTFESGRLVIDGRLRGRIDDCGDVVEVRGYGDIPIEELPLVRLRTPLEVELRVNSAGTTEIGPAQSVDAQFAGCGAAEIADVAGALKLDLAGAGRLEAGAAQSLDLDAAGATGASIGVVRDGANISVAGSGEVTIASLTGALDASSAGSGGLLVGAGAITDADINLAGSGSARIAAPIAKLTASIVGSGTVVVEGEVGELDANIAGSGGVRAAAVTGPVRQRVMGSGQIEIGR